MSLAGCFLLSMSPSWDPFLSVDWSTAVFSPPFPPPHQTVPPLLLLQEQSLLQPPTLQLLNGMGPLGRRASDGGANIQLHAQQLLKRPRGPSPLVTMTPVSGSMKPCLLYQRLLVKRFWNSGSLQPKHLNFFFPSTCNAQCHFHFFQASRIFQT